MNYGSTDPEAAAAAALPKAAQPIGSPRRAEIQDMAAGGGGVVPFAWIRTTTRSLSSSHGLVRGAERVLG